LLAVATSNVSLGATRVEIVIDEPHAQRSVAWPLTTGIPFPRGELASDRHCRLVDDAGSEQPLQTQVAATWDAERKSIRWLTIDFVAEPGHSYALEFGPDVRRRAFDTPLRVEPDDLLRIVTGAIAAEFSPTEPAALRSIHADLNGDGEFDSRELVLKGGKSGDHFYRDQDAKNFTSARDGSDRQIVVEVSGPVRACVRIDGFYTGPGGERVIGYRTRYHLFAGLGLVKVIDEFRIAGPTKGTRFHDVGFALALAGDPARRQVYADGSGEQGNQIVSVPWQPTTQSVSSFQATYRHFGNPDCRGAVVEETAAGERELRRSQHVGEWMQVVDGRSAVTGSLRWFWQQFPKQWEVTRDEMTLHLWSPRGGVLDFGADGLRDFFGDAGRDYILDWDGIRGTLNPISNFFYFAGHAALNRGDVDGQGINKHHEFYLHIAATDRAAAGQEYGQLAARPPLALATGAWNCSTDVFGPLASRPNDSKYEAIVDRIFDLGRDAQDSFGDYGWSVFGSGPHYSYQWDEKTQRHYADPRRFEYHTYQKETQLWWNYLRSGERKFIDWALPSENHWVDIAVTHVPLEYQCDWRGGFPKQQTLHFRPGDWSIDSAMYYVRQRDSAEAWLRGGSQFWASYHRTLETTTLAYYLTGDERFNDVLNYWREYWRDLAGKTSASPDVQPWHREQPWFVPTGPDEAAKSWAEMIRDYAPFTSGLRHQMTQFFSLATLYEHTWDPTIGQVLRECADAYLDPGHRIGVWRTQENGPPNHADAPRLCHFWVPALWKYGRATGDPRMKQILRGYFDACYAADPFDEDVGAYSNVHLGYAYYYTQDPRHLRPALNELARLLPYAEPLARPEDLGQRLYNPYAPIKALTAVPRLTWALDAAARTGVALPPAPPLKPQRTAIGLRKLADKELLATLWGYDRQLRIVGPDGQQFDGYQVVTKQYSSDIQPFDRNLRNFEVFLHDVTIPKSAPAGYYVFAPKLELAVLGVSGDSSSDVVANAAVPIAVDPGTNCRLAIPRTWTQLQLASAIPTSLQVQDVDREPLPKTTEHNLATWTTPERLVGQTVTVRNIGRGKVWFQIVDHAAAECWVSFADQPPRSRPSLAQTAAALPKASAAASNERFVSGKFGQAIHVVPGPELQLPDHITSDGETEKLFDLQQGTIEFWINRRWDERVAAARPVTFLSNGLVEAWSPWKLPVGEWAHVAVEWRPLKRDPSRQAVHIYVNGHDQQSYRSTWWEGYSQHPRTFRRTQKWLQAFICRTQPNQPFALDELRISSRPRYADLNIELGGQQTFNPSRFDPPAKPFAMDEHTLLLYRFDGDLSGFSAKTPVALTGRVRESP
jgi:hypothetical protein